MNTDSLAATIWSAETCLRFDCLGDLSTLRSNPMGSLVNAGKATEDGSARQSRVQRLGLFPRADLFDGDKSPAQSADRSAHSKAQWLRCQPLWFNWCPSVVELFYPG